MLSAFEYIDRTAYDLAVKHGQGRALDERDIEGAECFILVETSGGKKEHDEEASQCSYNPSVFAITGSMQKLNDLLEGLLEADEPLITTGVLSQSPTQFAQMWALREGIPEAASKAGKIYKYDISIPLQAFKEFVDITREHIRSKGLLREGAVRHVLGYGHVGDGMAIRTWLRSG